MSIDDTIEEAVARLFHDTYERLAPEFGYETRRESAVSWEEVPENNRLLMIATVKEVIEHLTAAHAAADAGWDRPVAFRVVSIDGSPVALRMVTNGEGEE